MSVASLVHSENLNKYIRKEVHFKIVWTKNEVLRYHPSRAMSRASYSIFCKRRNGFSSKLKADCIRPDPDFEHELVCPNLSAFLYLYSPAYELIEGRRRSLTHRKERVDHHNSGML